MNGLRLSANRPLRCATDVKLRLSAVMNLRAVDPARGAPPRLQVTASVIRACRPAAWSASVRLSWDELRSHSGSSARRERDLFRVISEAGGLLVAPHPLEEDFRGGARRARTGWCRRGAF
ncbi:MAG: hypothetical protein U0527_09150 [Candidatus Eisenbacteria bacterium]